MTTNTFIQPDFSQLIDASKDFFSLLEEKQKSKINVQLHLPYEEGRSRVENFIWKGFKQHYGANIQHFLPNLISIGSQKKTQSALGFRGASDYPMFIEQYLTQPIEMFFDSENIVRKQIGEIGNLLGTKKLLTRQLFIITAMAISKAGYKKLVFCATPQIKSMLQSLAMTTHYIAKADPKCLGSQINCWGSYYESTPELLAIDLDQALFLINQSKRYSKISKTFTPMINQLAANLLN